MKTYQDIVDAREAISVESMQAHNKIDNEARLKYQALQIACKEVGHVFGPSLQGYVSEANRRCLFCYAVEPTTTPATAPVASGA